MLLVRFELYVQLDERRAGSVLEVNDARVDDSDRLEGSEVRGLPRQREICGKLYVIPEGLEGALPASSANVLHV